MSVELARSTVEAHLGRRSASGVALPSIFEEKRGVFVTLRKRHLGSEALRGCIGFPYPVRRLAEAIQAASIAAASEDLRFSPVKEDELASIVFEVSVLSRPSSIDSEPRSNLPSMLRKGKDGLMISNNKASGLLLPQVATEFGMDQARFLSQVCVKAGLSPDEWLDRSTKIQTFQAEVFSERTPNGEIVRTQE